MGDVMMHVCGVVHLYLCVVGCENRFSAPQSGVVERSVSFVVGCEKEVVFCCTKQCGELVAPLPLATDARPRKSRSRLVCRRVCGVF